MENIKFQEISSDELVKAKHLPAMRWAEIIKKFVKELPNAKAAKLTFPEGKPIDNIAFKLKRAALDLGIKDFIAFKRKDVVYIGGEKKDGEN